MRPSVPLPQRRHELTTIFNCLGLSGTSGLVTSAKSELLGSQTFLPVKEGSQPGRVKTDNQSEQ